MACRIWLAGEAFISMRQKEKKVPSCQLATAAVKHLKILCAAAGQWDVPHTRPFAAHPILSCPIHAGWQGLAGLLAGFWKADTILKPQ